MKHEDMDVSALKGFIAQLARESARCILPFFGNPELTQELKADRTPVTAADRGAEEILRRLIEDRFPEHGILGEEYGSVRPGADYVWTLDPIDGTKSFVAGTPQFGTLICLSHHGQPVLGAMHNPVTGQLLIGDGRETTCNGRPCRVRSNRKLEEAVVLTTELSAPAVHQDAVGWARLLRTAGKVYTWGDCHGYHLVATGGADAMCDPVMSPWDLLALIPVIRGAGGVITDWHGQDPVRGTSCIAATTPELHARIIDALHP
jgi:myo-inositol-1(or 4)-monophosphatase